MAEQNIIEVVLRSVDQMSCDLAALDKRFNTFQGTTNDVGRSFNAASSRATQFRQSLGPVTNAIGQATTAIALLNPETKFLVSSLDNLVLSGARAATTAGSIKAAFGSALAAVFNPVTVGALALVSALGYLIDKWQDGARAKEEFDKAVSTNNVSFFSQKIVDAQKDLETYRQKLEAAELAQLQFNAETAGRKKTPAENVLATQLQANVDAAKGEMQGAISVVQQYEQAQTSAARAIALKALPALSQQIKLQRESIGATELQKISIEAVNAVNEQLFKGLTDEEIAEYKVQIARLANAKAGDLIKKTNQSVLDGIKSQSAAIEEQIILLTRGEAAQREFAAAQAIKRAEQQTGVKINRGPIDAELKAAEERAKILERTKTSLEQEAETEEGLRLIRKLSVEDVKALAAQEQARVTGPLQATQIALESQRDILNFQLQDLVAQEAPLNSILELARSLDAIEKQILDSRIAQQKALVESLRTRGEDVQVAEAQLQALERSAAILGQRVNQIIRDTQREIKSAADSLAKDFVDRFIALFDNRGKGGFSAALKDFLATTGKTVIADIGQSLLSSVLEPQLGALKTATGKTPSNVGELLSTQLISTLRSILPGIFPQAAGAAGQTAATTQLTTAGTTLNTAGTNLNAAAVALQSAATALSALPAAGAAAQLPTTAQDALDAEEGRIRALAAQAEATSGSLGLLSKVSDQTSLAFAQTVSGISGFLAALSRLSGGGGSSAGGIFGAAGALLSGISGLSKFFATNPSVYFSPGGIPSFFPQFAHGGMVIPKGFLRPFQHGGMVRNGPVMGIIGEEGPEIVARMKPARGQDASGERIVVNTIIEGDIVPREPTLKPSDVVKVVVSNAERGGPVAKAMTNVIKRHR